MKVLLDQNLDQRLRKHLDPHEVFTASYKGWEALKNGKLLDVAEADGFDVLVTGDQTISFEQNLTGRKLAVVVLSAVEWRIMKVHLPQILAAIDSAARFKWSIVALSRERNEEPQSPRRYHSRLSRRTRRQRD